MRSKLTRWLREGIVLLLIGVAISLAVDYVRKPALPQNFTSTPLQTLDGRTVDLAAMSHVGCAGDANSGRNFARRGEVGHQRLDQRLGDAPAAVDGVVAHLPRSRYA